MPRERPFGSRHWASPAVGILFMLRRTSTLIRSGGLDLKSAKSVLHPMKRRTGEAGSVGGGEAVAIAVEA